jgi:hypothetical protein
MALQPPFLDPPIAEHPTGQQFSHAWTEHLQSLVDHVNSLTAQSGITDGSEAAAGRVGEFRAVSVDAGAAVSMGSFTAIDVTHLDLEPGDWDVWGNVVFAPAGSTTCNTIAAWISPVSATPPAGETAGYVTIRAAFVTGQPQALAVGHVRLLNSAAQSLHLSALAGFAASTMAAYGTLSARRVR